METEEDNWKTSEFITLMSVPTHVLKYGQIPPGHPHTDRVMFVLIPGNPGIIEYYDQFMKVLFLASDCKVPVWGVSHAGHVKLPNAEGGMFELEGASKEAYTLKGQIKHKLTFIKDHIPEDVKLMLIGHSIGCYMILKLLHELDSHHVLRCFMLFPTVERMAISPKGQIATPMLKYLRWLGTLIVMALSYLSPHVQYRIILWYFRERNVPECSFNASMSIFEPSCVSNIMFMANQEMAEVTALDENLVHDHLSKLSFYYGREDLWCPQQYYYEMKRKFPHGDIRLCVEGFDHAYVLDSSDEMAQIVWKWALKDIHKLTE